MPSSSPTLLDRGLTAIRLTLGLAFLAEGCFILAFAAQRIDAAVAVRLGLYFLAGIALLSGLFARWAAITLGAYTILSIRLPLPMPDLTLFELALLCSVSIGGPGALALGRPLRRTSKPKAITVARIATGLMALAAGVENIVHGASGLASQIAAAGLPAPWAAGFAIVLVELIAGLALVTGLFTRWAAATLAVEGLLLTAFLGATKGIDYAVLLLGAAIALAIAGPGTFALRGPGRLPVPGGERVETR